MTIGTKSVGRTESWGGFVCATPKTASRRRLRCHSNPRASRPPTACSYPEGSSMRSCPAWWWASPRENRDRSVSKLREQTRLRTNIPIPVEAGRLLIARSTIGRSPRPEFRRAGLRPGERAIVSRYRWQSVSGLPVRSHRPMPAIWITSPVRSPLRRRSRWRPPHHPFAVCSLLKGCPRPAIASHPRG